MLDLYNLFNNLMQQYINKMNVDNIINKRILVDEYKIEDKMDELKECFGFIWKNSFYKINC